MSRMVRFAASLTLLCCVSMAGPGFAAKDRSDPLADKIERERRTLEKLQQEIQDKKKHADRQFERGSCERSRNGSCSGVDPFQDSMIRFARVERRAIDTH